MDIGILLATWLHTVAFVIAWGYYGVMARIVMPALGRSLDPPRAARSLAAIDGKALPLVGLSVVLFMVTGSYLLFVDPQYAGLGNIMANAWTRLMTLKHLVIVGMIVAAGAFTYLVRSLPNEPDDVGLLATIRWARWAAEGTTVVGAIVALLTVAAQLSL